MAQAVRSRRQEQEAESRKQKAEEDFPYRDLWSEQMLTIG